MHQVDLVCDRVALYRSAPVTQTIFLRYISYANYVFRLAIFSQPAKAFALALDLLHDFTAAA